MFAFLISATYPNHGKVAAAAGLVCQFGMLSLSVLELLPSHTATRLPGVPASAHANTFEFAGGALTLTGGVVSVQLQVTL